MTCSTALNNEDLLQRLADYNNTPSAVEAIRAEILRRMVEKSQIRQADTRLIDQVVKTAKAMENSDSDLLNQSEKMKELSHRYHELKKQILIRMRVDIESGVLCKTT